jgi:hypothetical protein
MTVTRFFYTSAPLVAGIVAMGLLSAPAHAQKAKAKPAIDPQATEQLKKMSDYMAKAQGMSFETDSSIQVVTKEGQKLNFDAESTVSVQRPNKLRSERKGAVTDLAFYYDGSKVSVFGKNANMFAQTDAPATLDKTIDFTRDKLGIDAPAADLLYSKPYEILTEDVKSGMYVGKTRLRGIDVHHLAFRGTDVDWQIWIADGPEPMPLKYLIVSKKEKQAPEFEVDIKKFNASAKFPENHFAFVPPEGAQKIAFANEVGKKSDDKRVR